jgi:hypothetical protein
MGLAHTADLARTAPVFGVAGAARVLVVRRCAAARKPLNCTVETMKEFDDERKCDCHVKSSNESRRVEHRQDWPERRRTG